MRNLCTEVSKEDYTVRKMQIGCEISPSFIGNREAVLERGSFPVFI